MLRTAPVQAWVDQSVPPDRPSVTLELDLLVMSYLRKIHKQEVS